VTGDERPTPIDFGDWSFNERSHDSSGTTEVVPVVVEVEVAVPRSMPA
jgi:hypothetical protein